MAKQVRIAYETRFSDIPKHLLTDQVVAINNMERQLSHAYSLFELIAVTLPDIGELGCGIMSVAKEDLLNIFPPVTTTEFVRTRKPIPATPTLTLVKGGEK